MAEVAQEAPEHLIEIFRKEVLFRKSRQARNWQDWHLPSIKNRRDKILSILQKAVRIFRERGSDIELRYFTRLAKHLDLLKSEPVEIQELYLQVLTVSLLPEAQNPGWFSHFLSGESTAASTSLFYWQIVTNNLNLGRVFAKHNLNWERWINYPAAKVNIEADNNSRVRWQQLNAELNSLVAVLGEKHPLRASLQKDCMAIRQRKKEILEGRPGLLDLDSADKLFPTLCKSLAYLTSKAGGSAGILVPYSFKCALFDIGERVIDVSRRARVRNFAIKLWDRDPLKDLLLGNHIGNCLAIGEKDIYPIVQLPGVPGKRRPAGVLDYLIDKGVQVVEINELRNADQEWISGQCYVFIFLDDLDGEKPVLMVDSINLHPSYRGRHKSLTLKMRNALFDFLRGYARAVGIEKVVLAKDGPILKSGKNKGKRHMIDNEVDVSDLRVRAFTKIDKLGGYWNHRPYFLESVGGSEAYVIS